MATARVRAFGRAWKWSARSRFVCAGVWIRPVRPGGAAMEEAIMTESRDAPSVRPSAGEMPPIALTFDERRARWQVEGSRQDARVARPVRLIAAIVLAIGVVIWAFVSLG